jgi:hypothetical protein
LSQTTTTTNNGNSEDVEELPKSHNNASILDTNQSNSSLQDESDDEDEDLVFRSSSLYQKTGGSCISTPNDVLKNRFLVTSQQDSGEALLWDLHLQKRLATICSSRGGSGLAVRRTENPSRILFQTRDPMGMVSLHAMERSGDVAATGSGFSPSSSPSSIIRQFETYSQTFCAAAPCVGDQHLVALPSGECAEVVVVDDRAKERVAKYSTDGHGMVTSLAMIRAGHGHLLHNNWELTTVMLRDGGREHCILGCVEGGVIKIIDVSLGQRTSPNSGCVGIYRFSRRHVDSSSGSSWIGR